MKAHLMPISVGISLAFWITLGGLHLLEAWQDTQVIPVLLAAQSGLMAWLLVTRNQQALEVRWQQKIIAWFSAMVPLALRIDHESMLGNIITGLGMLIVLWAMGTLGRSFGVAPADRGIVNDGPYHFIRHPMYLGELISLAGALTRDPSIWNIFLILVLLLTLLLRIRWEELVVLDYGNYARQVPWRLIPGIW
jgi:protein-S-isoprenylcysteine O-methyltransferase Ste14